jgi:hypothetical protein
MISKFRISLVLALLLTLAIAVPVYAGGWAVITLDELPTGVISWRIVHGRLYRFATRHNADDGP